MSVLLMLAAAAGLISGLSAAAYADWIQYQEASYSDSDGVTYETKIASNATALTSSTTNWSNGGWYYVQGSVTISSRITFSGTVNLILCDGATLSLDKGIRVARDYTLNIYAQTGGTGTLKAYGGDSGNAGIGSANHGTGGTVTIYGGTVTAVGGGGSYAGAGIGGGYNGNGGNVTIYGGTVTATGGNSDAHGIGRGNSGNGYGSLTVGSGVVVYGGSSPDPTTVISDPDNNRFQYMKAVAGQQTLSPVSYVSFDVLARAASLRNEIDRYLHSRSLQYNRVEQWRLVCRERQRDGIKPYHRNRNGEPDSV